MGTSKEESKGLDRMKKKKKMVTTIVSLNQQSTHVLQGRG